MAITTGPRVTILVQGNRPSLPAMEGGYARPNLTRRVILRYADERAAGYAEMRAPGYGSRRASPQ